MTNAPGPTDGGQYHLPGNSKKSKIEKPEIKKLEGADAVQRKQSLGRRIAASFTGDDTRTVGNYVFFDVILPAIKSLVVEAGNSFLERLILGAEGRGGGARRGYTAYNRYATQGTQQQPKGVNRTPDPRAVHNFDDIIMDNRGAAEQVIDALAELISNYHEASVADLYQLVGISGSYMDEKWGWYSMAGARVEIVRNGYLLRLPRTTSLVD